MKNLGLALMASVLAACVCSSKPAAPLGRVLAHPLIIGASQSADRGTKSPGERLALRHAAEPDVVKVARDGAPGRDVIARLSDDALASRTVVLSTDLLFWDSTHAEAAPSVAALESLVSRAEGLGIPLVLADVPALLPARQPSRAALNEAIKDKCTAARGCSVLPLDALFRELWADGFLEIEGRRYTRRELLPDGLHLSAVAAEYLASAMESALTAAR